jgi:hypothetical protein
MSTTARPFRLRGLLAAGLLSTAVLTGCGGDDADDLAAPTDAKSAQASAKPEPEADLASGLLGAEAFGPTAVVTAVSPEQLEQGAALSGDLGDVQVTPPECDAAVQGTQPNLDDFDDVAAVSAAEETSVVVEMLIRGGPVEGTIDQLASAAERCPQVQVSSPQTGDATVTFEQLPVPDLGDGAAALRFTTVVALPDGTQVSVPALLGAVEDGDRLVILTSLAPDPAAAAVPLDVATFTSLLEQAYETQADALD